MLQEWRTLEKKEQSLVLRQAERAVDQTRPVPKTSS